MKMAANLSFSKRRDKSPILWEGYMIETNRCFMTRVQYSDYEELKELYTDERVRKFLGGIVSNERFDASFNNMITCNENSYYWVVRLRNIGEFIGLISLDKHHDGFSTEVSYQFMPQYWGYGYAEEVGMNLEQVVSRFGAKQYIFGISKDAF